MRSKFGITSKLFAWFLSIVLIFYGTVLLLYINAQQIVTLSESIVNTNYPVTAYSKKMVENLLYMEENDKKYHLLNKKDYFDFFVSAKTEFEDNLAGILHLKFIGRPVSENWDHINEAYTRLSESLDLYSDKQVPVPGSLWVSEAVINGLIGEITSARMENEQSIQATTLEINRLGLRTARNGLLGLGIASTVGLFGIIFLAYSMIRPIRELRKGIRAVAKDNVMVPIRVRSKDEFGELAATFNKMTSRLKEEEQMRSDFIAILSHEIRTPLTSIQESVNLLYEEVMGPVNPRQEKFLKIAATELDRIRDLLNRLMMVSRLESGGLAITPRPVKTSVFVSDCIRRLSAVAEAKGITITAKIPSNLPGIMADVQQLERVMANLLGNAIKFSAAGDRIAVVARTDNGGRNVAICVSDNGPGIPETEHLLIFNKYYQAKGMRAQTDGVGLGLSIVKRIVRAHKGDIQVTSRVGKGSTFCFTVPALVAKTESKQP